MSTSANHTAFAGITQLSARYGRTRQTIDRWRKAGKFPKPDGATPAGRPLWKIEHVDAFLKQLLEA